MTMPWVQPQPKRSVMVGRRERNITSPSHPSCFIITARCGHKWVTSVSVRSDDGCKYVERLLDRHESLCRPGLVHRPGW